ncbi:MAG: polysaccharide biosynthesis protein [Chloroflexales bacterium]|nr:polysaccharide biosynthesis protein [Chloroflexales bacterium]
MPMVSSPIRNRFFFAADVLLLPVAAYLSFVIRLETLGSSEYLLGFLVMTVLATVITPAVFQASGIYSRYWRYASIEELFLLVGAVLVATVVASGGAILASAVRLEVNVPRSVPFIYLMLAIVVTALPRLLIRVRWSHSLVRHRARHEHDGSITRVLIMGAGSAGSMIMRELRQNPQLGLEVVGFIDDDPLKHNVHIHGVPVRGNRHDIPRLASEYHVDEVIIAMPTAPGKVIRSIVELCEHVGVRTRSMPGIYELLDGKISVSQLRDVQIEDLLRRKPVRTDIGAVRELLRGRRVLVTGGGGSIGSELCRQVLRCEPAELIVMGHGENSVFTVEHELRKHLPAGTRLSTVIADVRFPQRVSSVFNQFRPEIVFHAAAHKHVPLMELNMAEAITNNVLGTRNLLDAARAVDVQHFVMISTDKAVNPTSVMGASKRVAELLVHQAATSSGKPYVAVRFGNVLGSRGSVVLTFNQQIAAGGPVTVTHPEMVRFFMTIPEATQLVLQAATLGNGGEVFTLDMGEPVRIVDLARDMIELSGLEVGRDIDIAFTGMRPGEKLYEELFIAGEEYQRTFHEKIFIACNASNLVPSTLDEAIRGLELAAGRDDSALILQMLHALIPSFQHQGLSPALPAPGSSDRSVGEPLRARVIGGTGFAEA